MSQYQIVATLPTRPARRRLQPSVVDATIVGKTNDCTHRVPIVEGDTEDGAPAVRVPPAPGLARF